MRQFVPLTDEMLYQMGGLPGPLVPYRAGLACAHALVDEAAKTRARTEVAADEPKAARPASATAPAPYTSSASACP